MMRTNLIMWIQRFRLVWIVLTRKHFVCYAYNRIRMSDGRISGATMTENLPCDDEESTLFLGVVGECICERCKEMEQPTKK